MKIAIIGTGNVGGALATKWAKKGHEIYLGVRDVNNFKGKELLANPNNQVLTIENAVATSEIILISTPATSAIDVAKSLGNTSGKIIIDTMNIVMGRGPEGYKNTTAAILDNTETNDVGDSVKGKEIAIKLAKDAGFAECYNIGGNDKFELMEQFAWFWINLAMFQGQGRDIAFKLLKR